MESVSGNRSSLGASRARYGLFDAESQHRIADFDDILNFFSADPAEFSGDVESLTGNGKRLDFQMVGRTAQQSDLAALTKRRTATNLYIEILSVNGGVIGQYYVSMATFHDLMSVPNGDVQMTVSGFVDWIPARTTKAFWELWVAGAPTRKGIWEELPQEHRQSWLEVVAMYSPPVRSQELEGSNKFVLDGKHIEDLASFFCAIGETLNGPGGYYGRNLYALTDCLKGGYGPRAPFALHWTDFAVAQRFLSFELPDRDHRITEIEAIIEIFQQGGVKISISQ